VVKLDDYKKRIMNLMFVATIGMSNDLVDKVLPSNVTFDVIQESETNECEGKTDDG
jgi:hypothetical protein